jgi:hypothetical protein
MHTRDFRYFGHLLRLLPERHEGPEIVNAAPPENGRQRDER